MQLRCFVPVTSHRMVNCYGWEQYQVTKIRVGYGKSSQNYKNYSPFCEIGTPRVDVAKA
jgi:hypothetical protein